MTRSSVVLALPMLGSTAALSEEAQVTVSACGR